MSTAVSSTPVDVPALHGLVLDWYAVHARDLPWRAPGCSPWGVLVSEVMLQQTPVARVEPVWRAWMERWPTPTDLARESAGEAVRAWGRLGYPRRALRLHRTAMTIAERHGGRVPATESDLLALPGVGEYTAAAVAAFAFGERTTVLDTNVRRVLERVLRGRDRPAPSLTRAEVRLAESLVPRDPVVAARWSVAVMELGALVCTARSPCCAACPLSGRCRWRADGHPVTSDSPRRGQAWHGTDRQCRGVLLAYVRADVTGQAHPRAELETQWSAPEQARRCLDSLVADGLLEPTGDDHYRLPA